MLKITAVSAAQAKNYYAKDDYYTQGEAAKNESRWLGCGSQRLGLSGEVDKDDFQALLNGVTPQGELLQAKKITIAKHRAGYDLTFSADKSVSFAALVLGDERVIAAHDQAVERAIAVAEARYAQARVWHRAEKSQSAIATGNVIAAVFRHETSRNLDPQLHSHAVLLNSTQDQQGSWRALHVDGIFAEKKLVQLVYHNELAYRLRHCGYAVEASKEGSCKIKGFDDRSLEAFSSRRQQIEKYVAKQVAAGADRNGALYQQAAIATRKRKQETPHAALAVEWKSVAIASGVDLPELPQSQPLEPADITELVWDALTHAGERESVFKRSKIELFALEQEIGRCSFDQLQQAIDANHELVKIDRSQDRFTTQVAIEREIETIHLMEHGKGTQQPISSMERVLEICPGHLTAGQRQGVELLLTTSDRVVAWQGVAGAGKTYALAIGVQEAEMNGYTVRCFAPSAESAKGLGEAIGVSADTVASFLVSKHEPSTQPQMWLVDEAGLLSAKDAHALLKQAETQNARLVLVGDTKQLSAVEAGNPFKSLQAAGMAIASLTESLRQKTATLKQAVAQITQGNIGSGYKTLESAGLIHQTDNVANQAAQQYLSLSPKQQEKTLVIAGTNATRLKTVELIRAGLQAEGRLGQDRYEMLALRPRDLTEAQAKYAKNYKQGDVIVPVQNYKRHGLARGQQYEVLEIDVTMNRLRVQSQAGEPRTIGLSQCSQITAYEQQHIQLALNEPLRWTRNDRTTGRRNGQAFRLLDVDEAGNATIQYSNGTLEQTTFSGKQFIDSALVSTTYGSQGKTADRVIAIADGRISQEAFYVATSRAKYQIDIYCTDRAKFAARAQESQANENPSDYLDLFAYRRGHYATHQVRQDAQADRGLDPQGVHDSRNRGQRLGASVSRQLAATLWRDRPDAGADRLPGKETAAIDRSLADFNRTTPIAGIDVAAVADAVAAFVERREIGRGGAAVSDALSAIDRSLRQLADLSRTIAERDLGSDRHRLVEEPPQLTPEQEQQRRWAKAIFPMALKLMRDGSQVELSSSTQTQIFSPHYEGIWDGDRHQLSYFRRKDGQRLFVATQESQNSWVLEQAENLVPADVAYHRVIGRQQQSRHEDQRQPNREMELG